MGGGNEVTRNLLPQEPGRKNRHANAADAPKVPHRKSKRHKDGTPYRVTPNDGDAFSIAVSGRTRWALEELRKAGIRGITAVQNPAPRLAAYVYCLRELGLDIETITEPHEGDYPGHHGRYVLCCSVTPDWKGGAQ